MKHVTNIHTHAQVHNMGKAPMQDRVKYAGIGGIVFCTGLLAAVSGGYAFHTIFGPKGDANDYSLTASIAVKIFTFIFIFLVSTKTFYCIRYSASFD
jgi:hypothetical protein